MKTLLVYYSYTGNTKIIADMIKEKLNCDILGLKPKIPYSRIIDMMYIEDDCIYFLTDRIFVFLLITFKLFLYTSGYIKSVFFDIISSAL